MKKFFLALFMLPLVAGCEKETGPDVSGNQVFVLNADELASSTEAAEAGDIKAVRRLISHYEALSGDQAIISGLKQQARSLGDPLELYLWSEDLRTLARKEPDQHRRAEMLIEALDAAKTAKRNGGGKSVEKLIGLLEESLASNGGADKDGRSAKGQ